MDNTNEIIIFGDAKGTKYHLQNALYSELAENMGNIHNAFSKTFLDFYQQSRNLYGFTLSDSVIAKWTNELEGIRFCIPFAIDFFSNLDTPYRIFIDSGKAINNKRGYGELANSLSNRYHNVLPISFPIWSVSVAESAHFPEGIFVGKNIYERLKNKYKFSGDFKAQDFLYKKLDLEKPATNK